ncbi:16S rRNA (cytosine(967)-C(5))-methyltransferase RsmB [Aurantivibrio infirmus]
MNTRSAAAKLIASILTQRGSLSSLLPAALTTIDERDRALLQELCYGVSRWQPKLQCYLNKLLDKPLRKKDSDVHALLLIGIYQLAFMRVPDHAAINTTVDASKSLKKPWSKGLINAVLRNFQRQKDQLNIELKDIPEFRYAHPNWLIKKIKKAWPNNNDEIFLANNQHPPFTLRINKKKVQRQAYLDLLSEQDIKAIPTAFSEDGLTLQNPIDVNSLPLFAEGGISVQDEAPQLCAQLLELQDGLSVLDACCAPGGKTAHIAESTADLSRLVALDISAERLTRTRENLQRLQLDAELIVGDASQTSTWWDGKPFDRILIDAPCSATGVIRRNPDIKILRNPDGLAKLVDIQNAVLDALWPLLKPGGLLLYATCSVLPEENSAAIERFIAAHSDVIEEPIEAEWGTQQNHGQQLFPLDNSHDGFYYAKLRKKPSKTGNFEN